MSQLYTPALPLAQSPSSGPDPSLDVYQRLLRERIVFLGTEVEDRAAEPHMRPALAAGGRGPDA